PAHPPPGIPPNHSDSTFPPSQSTRARRSNSLLGSPAHSPPGILPNHSDSTFPRPKPLGLDALTHC
ncbi:hypothetical protein BJ508DRAFT_209701, partial [Ascobolus immersus RN42]